MEPATSQTNEPSDNSQPTRRKFLRWIWGILGGVAAVEAGVLSIFFMKPRLSEGEFGNTFTVGAVDEFPPGSITPVPKGRFYLSRLEDGGFLALYQRCTHLGCNVPWIQNDRKFVCPCHNSQFDQRGEVLNPPAPRALDLFVLSIENNLIQVDTGQIITRDHFDPSQVVYA